MFKFSNFKLLKIFFIILIFTFIVIISLNFTYSKFITSVKTNGNSRVARFVFNVNSGKDIVKDSLKSNEEVVYEFSVQNFLEENSCEVKSKYNISLELSQNNPPLIIELYRINSGKEELVELENYTTKFPEKFDMENKISNYKIKVRYDKNSQNKLEEGFSIGLNITDVQEEG